MKTTRYSLIMLLVFVLTGCTVVEVPEFDDTPPTYSFTIEGDDFQHVFTDKDDRSTYQLNVKPNVTYDFMYVSHDDGGVWRDEITVLTEPYMNLTIVEQGNYTEWDVKDVSFLSRIVSWQHREGSPVKDGNFLRGSFTFKPSDQGKSI